jgi:CheY-like chemotaxis protein
MQHVSFSLNDVLDDVSRQIGPTVGNRRAEKIFACADGVPADLAGDPANLHQILVDLIGSAFECVGSGELTADIDLVHRGAIATRRSAILRFAVRDSGTGLTSEEAAKILMVFASAGPAARNGGDAPGSVGGMELVDRMGGSVAASSEPGKGFAVSLTVEFGLRPETDAGSAKPGGRGRRLKMPDGMERIRGAHILLAEDHPVNQHLTREILVQAGCTVVIAEDGLEAVSAIRDRADRYDAVLMDVQMPNMDGFEATRRIRNDLAVGELPIIAMTANVLGDERQRCLDAGMSDYVPKPVHIPDLYAALIRWVEPHEPVPGQAADDVADEGAAASQEVGKVDLPAGIAGVDIESGLSRAVGNESLYIDLLIQFVKSNETVGEDVGAAIAKGDLDRARFLVHGLASTAGNLGAADLYAAANELEKAIVTGNGTIGDLFASFQGHLSGVLQAIVTSGITARDRPVRLGTGEAPLDREQVQRLVESLTMMLDEQDMQAKNRVGELLEILGGRGQDEQLKRLEVSLEALEFSEARQILAGICEEILE